MAPPLPVTRPTQTTAGRRVADVSTCILGAAIKGNTHLAQQCLCLSLLRVIQLLQGGTQLLGSKHLLTGSTRQRLPLLPLLLLVLHGCIYQGVDRRALLLLLLSWCLGRMVHAVTCRPG